MLCIRPNKNEKMVRDQKFLKTLLGKLDRGEIRRDFWLQRKSTQWNNQIRDQAIVTTVQGEDIDPVKICEEIREGKSSQKWIVDSSRYWMQHSSAALAISPPSASNSRTRWPLPVPPMYPRRKRHGVHLRPVLHRSGGRQALPLRTDGRAAGRQGDASVPAS